jgi:hypothetical protein
MSTELLTRATSHIHPEHLVDRAAMMVMRAMIALQPKADSGLVGRGAFDALMERTPAAGFSKISIAGDFLRRNHSR